MCVSVWTEKEIKVPQNILVLTRNVPQTPFSIASAQDEVETELESQIEFIPNKNARPENNTNKKKKEKTNA